MTDRPGHGAGDPLWYKDAVIYELHVKTFCDANGDGVGDFRGLIDKLDDLAALGVTCLWLLPFYESPLRDDGYDIADYERVHPSYGTLDDVTAFLAAAHARDLRVITELVINHTSDQHPWFEAARRAPAGSPARDFYVWSDTDQRYADVRVIFHDAESSNWTWDPVAGAFYWHRFFSHQPDLNFDNPGVRRAVLDVMRFWLDLGVDGLRLDAVAHLYEREGTSCENLPETHAFLKTIRDDMDRRYPGRVLLAEANGGPDEARPYFSTGDECHMAFHFPLMPRLFMALEQESAAPIVEIVSETADLPDACQWAVFLRNHDELSLSALGDDQRKALIEAYAPSPRMRLNRGIRRRLAPLLENDRQRLELAHALLFSLPGTPVLYYGDEIGMGDNVQLDDRDGLRTPMQWTEDAGAGFSRAAPQRLVLPPIDDAEYGYRRVNVAAQRWDAGSLWSAICRLIHLRRSHTAFGRGTIAFHDTGNRHVLAFTREHDADRVLVIANLAGTPQLATIPWPQGTGGLAVVNLIDGAAQPGAVGPATVALPRLGCYWLQTVDQIVLGQPGRQRQGIVRSPTIE
jgi:maltose alpha-D-glucosyltransferase/alpha-amylase